MKKRRPKKSKNKKGRCILKKYLNEKCSIKEYRSRNLMNNSISIFTKMETRKRN